MCAVGLQKCRNNYYKNLTDEKCNIKCHEGDKGLDELKRSQLDHVCTTCCSFGNANG
jgi:hypothetical protein